MIHLIRFRENGEPNDTASRFFELLETLASSIAKMYPGWRMRIYHNVTEDDEVFPHLCQLFCSHSHVDTCDTRQLPSEGDLNTRYPVGRMWRFQV